MSISVSDRAVAAAHQDLRAWLDAGAELTRAVNRDLPARHICAGVPAKPIRPIDYGAADVGKGEGEAHPQEP